MPIEYLVRFYQKGKHSVSYGEFKKKFAVCPQIGWIILVDEFFIEKLSLGLNSATVIRVIALKRSVIIHAEYVASSAIESVLKNLSDEKITPGEEPL